jgi:surface polysaccharide O-acyltransferase-like enzyme
MENHSTQSKRIFYADLIRTYAILAVIGIHVSAPLVNKWTAISMQWWWIGNLFNFACRPSVPLFVMISGMLLLNNRNTEGVYLFFKNRFLKVLIPFIFWAVIYYFWIAIVNNRSFSFFALLKQLFEGPIYIHFPFFQR